jgi:hypothetical protein
MMTVEKRIGRDLEGSGSSQFLGVIPANWVEELSQAMATSSEDD